MTDDVSAPGICLHSSGESALVRLLHGVQAGADGGIAITDLGIAMLERELASEQADRQSLLGVGNPSGGFHKRHLVRLSLCP
jgi:hypothetical protein